MVHLLYKYLILHKHAALPGVGVFFITRKPAKHDFVNRSFYPPALHIGFRAETAIPDPSFFDFVSREQGIDKVDAVKHLHEFASAVKHDVSQNKEVDLPGMGVLRKQSSGNFIFEPTDVLDTYFPTASAEFILRKRDGSDVKAGTAVTNDPAETTNEISNDEAEVATKRKDVWWIVAIVVALISVGAIIYYYFVNNGLR